MELFIQSHWQKSELKTDHTQKYEAFTYRHDSNLSKFTSSPECKLDIHAIIKITGSGFGTGTVSSNELYVIIILGSLVMQ